MTKNTYITYSFIKSLLNPTNDKLYIDLNQRPYQYKCKKSKFKSFLKGDNKLKVP